MEGLTGRHHRPSPEREKCDRVTTAMPVLSRQTQTQTQQQAMEGGGEGGGDPYGVACFPKAPGPQPSNSLVSEPMKEPGLGSLFEVSRVLGFHLVEES